MLFSKDKNARHGQCSAFLDQNIVGLNWVHESCCNMTHDMIIAFIVTSNLITMVHSFRWPGILRIKSNIISTYVLQAKPVRKFRMSWDEMLYTPMDASLAESSVLGISVRSPLRQSEASWDPDSSAICRAFFPSKF